MQEKCPTPSVPEMPLKKSGERQPAPKSPTGKQVASGGQEGSPRESPMATQEVHGGTQGAPTGEEEWEVSPLVKAGNRRVPKVVQDHILQSGCSLSNGPIENDKTPSRKA